MAESPRRVDLRLTIPAAAPFRSVALELAQKFAELERKLATHDQAITGILKAIHELMNPPAPRRRGIGFTADF